MNTKMYLGMRISGVNVPCASSYFVLRQFLNLLKSFVNEQQNADVVFGGVTILCGIVGTYCGGIFLDYIGSTLRNSYKV